MRADILSIVDNKITFNNFSGNNLANYRSTIFSTDEKIEFVALIGNEYVYMKSYDNGDLTEVTESATIIQRGLFSSTQEEITSDSVVTFYSIIAGTNTEGVLSSTSAFIGTDEDYLKFKPSIGLSVKTSGEVDISNATNRFYFDPSTVDNKSQLLIDVGDWSTGFDDVEFQIGIPTSGKGYFKYDDSDGLSMSGKIFLEDGKKGSGNLYFDNRFFITTYDLGGQNLFGINDLMYGGSVTYLSNEDSTGRIGTFELNLGGQNGVTERRIFRGGQLSPTKTFNWNENCYIDTRLNLSGLESHWVTSAYTGFGLYQNTSSDLTDGNKFTNRSLGVTGDGHTLFSNITGISMDGNSNEETLSVKDRNGSFRYVTEQISTTTVSVGGVKYSGVPVIRERVLFKTRVSGWVVLGEWTFTPDYTNTSRIPTSSVIL